jgi:hypothetical protein
MRSTSSCSGLLQLGAGKWFAEMSHDYELDGLGGCHCRVTTSLLLQLPVRHLDHDAQQMSNYHALVARADADVLQVSCLQA